MLAFACTTSSFCVSRSLLKVKTPTLTSCDMYRGRGATYKGMPLGRASTGRIVDWKPPGKETPQQPAKSGSQAHTASKDPKPSEQTPATSRLSQDDVCLCLSLCFLDTVSNWTLLVKLLFCALPHTTIPMCYMFILMWSLTECANP